MAWALSPRPWSKLQTLGVALMVAAITAGFATYPDLAPFERDWAEHWSARESELAELLITDLRALTAAGEQAADRIAALSDSLQGPALDDALASLRRETGMAGLALYGPGPDPRLITWDGDHQGQVPVEATLGTLRYSYGESPLFSYLYITAPVERTGGTAVAAALLRAELPPGLQGSEDDVASRFRRQTGESVRVFAPDRVVDETVWDFMIQDRSLFAVTVAQPSPSERRAETVLGWSRVVLAFLVGAWLLLAVGGHGRTGQLPLAAASLLVLVVLVPLDPLVRGQTYLSSAQFLLPGPVTVTLVPLLALAVAGAFVAGLLVPRRPGRVRTPWAPALLVVGGGFPLLGGVMLEGASGSLLSGPERSFVAFQSALALLLTLMAYAALRSIRLRPGRRGAAAAFLSGAAIPLLMVAYASVFVRQFGSFPTWALAFWAVPTGLLGYGLDRGGRGWRSVPRWILAGLLGATASLSLAWGARIDARIQAAEDRMTSLGVQVDPYLDFLLHRFGARAQALDASGAGAVEILYRSWVDSELAREGYPVWLTFWSPGDLPQEEFRIGVSESRPGAAAALLAEARRSDTVAVHPLARADANYLAVAPLPAGEVVTATVPSRREASATSPLSDLYAPDRNVREDPLTLVPLLEGDVATATETPRWSPEAEGWRGEMLLATADQSYDAHFLVAIPGPLVLSARATVILFLNMVTFFAAWGAGRTISLGLRPPFAGWLVAVTSFRARVTLALFGFFLLSNAIFGTVAFQALSTATQRASETLAERITDDAAGWYNELQGAMELLALRVGGDLLEYRDGALRDGSVEELVRLGVYPGWLPLPVHQLLSSRRELRTVELSGLGRFAYATAFRRLPDGDVLAAPVSLRAGAEAVRRREVMDLLAFAVIVGALLSLGLALLVGRALARPLLILQVASERVGGGNLRVRLPEERADEFGSVFVAFNRMVGRLRRARRDLVRTTRRTEAIVEEAATGVVALDAAGRVTLVNPRAEGLLGRPISVGKPLSEEGGPSDELARWVRLYFRDGVRESATDLQLGDRRMSIRARRIERQGPLGGAVLSIEDVTDELRTERILAWGEMAQQVAHEVKNPLTPIKLSVQHIRRAWEDRRKDFGAILTKNVDAILGEIDRLASIATSFSRFGAPRAAGEEPLETVDLGDVVGETLALYGSGAPEIAFEGSVGAEVPRVTARRAEMKEVLINLLENARAAVETQGVVKVEASLGADTVDLRVRDNGAGIPEELMSRIFEPHFSTRSTGTGLGLAIVRRLVESWGGSVDIESSPGRGTVVRMALVPWRDEGSATPVEGSATPVEAPATPAGESEA